ncbi:transposase [Bacteroides fragilis]
MEDANAKDLRGIIDRLVKKGSTVISDSWSGYHSVKDSYTHEVVQHSLGIYVNKKGFHTNSIGGFRGHLKG